MTASTMDLDVLAHRLGVTLLEHEGGEHGRFYGHGVISLRKGLGHRARRCAIAHELGHYVLGHNPQATGWWRDKQEVAANRWAADILITPDAYKHAETLHGPHPGAIALELDVTINMVETWRTHRATITN